MAKRRRIIRWILGTAPVACVLGVLAAVVSGEVLLITLALVAMYGPLAGGFVWLCAFLTRGLRIRRALAGGFYSKALQLLQKWRRNESLLATVRDRIPFPNDGLKQRMVAVVSGLLELQMAASDRSNPHIPEDLRTEIKSRSSDLLLSLWPKCQDLALLTRTGMDAVAVEAKVAQISQPLENLAEIINTTRSRLVRTTLEGSSLELHDALENAGAMKWQVSESSRIQAMLEGSSLDSPSPSETSPAWAKASD